MNQLFNLKELDPAVRRVVQRLNAHIQSLETQIADLQTQIDDLDDRVTVLEP